MEEARIPRPRRSTAEFPVREAEVPALLLVGRRRYGPVPRAHRRRMTLFCFAESAARSGVMVIDIYTVIV